jgi:hypothetical protein
MSIRTVGEYLKNWGFTPQKPLRRAYVQNPKLVQPWLDVQYPANNIVLMRGLIDFHDLFMMFAGQGGLWQYGSFLC